MINTTLIVQPKNMIFNCKWTNVIFNFYNHKPSEHENIVLNVLTAITCKQKSNTSKL